MGWTNPPKTWASDVVSVADLNTELRDQLNALLAGIPPAVQGRLTLATGTPFPTSDTTGATNLYLTPYQGGRIWLYDGAANWIPYIFTEITISLAGLAASTNYDVFAYLSGGVVVCETVAWSTDTARATGITLVNGIYVKSGTTTKRYLGTFRTTSAIGQCEDSVTKRYLWNYYHRMRVPVRVLEATNSWTYQTATWRQANGNTANQVELVCGVAEDLITLAVTVLAGNSGANLLAVGIGENSTSSPSPAFTRAGAIANSMYTTLKSDGAIVPAAGYSKYCWLEWSTASATSTWYGDNGGTEVNGGMVGTWVR